MPTVHAVHVFALGALALGASMLVQAGPAYAAQSPVGLGTADSFAVLAGAGITNTGPTTITGDVGTLPTPSESGFASVTLHGANHAGDAVTQVAKDDLATAYDDAFGRLPAADLAVELGGTTLQAGVYRSGTFGLTGTLTLDAAGDPNAQFIFQAGSTLIAETNSRVKLINGANPCRVVWQVGSSATFKAGTRFVGDVLALTSITAQTGATFRGRLLARNGAVTLDTNTINNDTCASAAGGTTTSTTTGGTTSTTTVGTPTTTLNAAVPDATPTPGAPVTPTGTPTETPAWTPTGTSPGTPPGTPIGSPDDPSTPTPRASSTATPRVPSAPPGIAITGTTVSGLVVSGLALVAVGGALLVARRRAGGPAVQP